mmetsp:Transcript_9000/g.25070  ORF Transcript_9000/g.25070 Transcript_9000/m.25070 type:complete len:376 (-) Transcript_9000:15-1142(-)
MVLDLEGVADERRVGLGLQRHLLRLVVREQSSVFAIQRRGQVPADGIQEVLHTLVLHRGAHEHWRERPCQGGPSDRGMNCILWHLVVLQINLRKLVVEVSKHLQQFRPQLRHALAECRWNVVDAAGESLVALEVHSLPRDHIAHAYEAVLLANGQLDRLYSEAELLADLAEHQERVGTVPVKLVDKNDPRDLVALHLPVHGDGLALHAANPAADQDRAVQDAQGSLHFDGEIHVAWRVDEVQVVIGPLRGPPAVSRCRGYGDALLPLELHAVHLGPHAVLAPHLVDRFDATCVEEDPLGERRLATVDVCGDAEIPDGLRGPDDSSSCKGSPGCRARCHAHQRPSAGNAAYSQHCCCHAVKSTPSLLQGACHEPRG